MLSKTLADLQKWEICAKGSFEVTSATKPLGLGTSWDASQRVLAYAALKNHRSRVRGLNI